MTAGALTQIKNGNTPRMAFLVSNPEISHFKAVYRKHTNFSTQYLTVLPNSSNTLDNESTIEIDFKINRDSDLINDIYFTFELPDIYSRNNLKFQWIKRIGEYIIKDVRLQVGNNTLLDRQYSEWFHIWSELNLNKDQKEGYYRMIGNTQDMYDPESVTGHGGTYPGTTDGTTKVYPSIVGRKLYVPLHFWFNHHSSSSLPLIAIQYDEIHIKMTLRPLKEIYTILGTTYRERPSTSDHVIGKFLSTSSTQSTLDINPRLEVRNIYLDNEERKKFALITHEYLATQVQRIIAEGRTNDFDIDLKDLNKPIKQLYFIVRRSDFEDVNLWSNFTNWYYPDTPIYAEQHPEDYAALAYDDIVASPANLKYYKTKSLVKSAELTLETHSISIGTQRDFTGAQQSLEGKDNNFFNLMQNYKSSKSIPEEGIYTYAFNLDDINNRQPNGSCNMSNLSKKELRLFLNETFGGNSYNIYVFGLNYEIVKVMGGLVGTAFSN